MFSGWFELLAGLTILAISGEFLVKSAVKLAVIFRVSSLVIGLTIVSFGTSLPELVVSLDAALMGHPDIATGNVVGSNISNLGLVLGLTCLIFPLVVSRANIRVHWPMMILATVLVMLFSIDYELQRWEGVFLFSGLVLYNFYLIKRSRQSNSLDQYSSKVNSDLFTISKWGLMFVVSSAVLILGSDMLVSGAAVIARSFGVSERVIGVTIIAFGTSTPELATSIIAAYRKHADVSIGNLIGSNIFNLMGILGLSSAITPISVNRDIVHFDLWWCLGIPLLILPLLMKKYMVTKFEGILLLLAYSTYIFLLF